VRDTHRDHTVVTRSEDDRALRGLDDRGAVQHMKALLERVEVHRQPPARFELTDAEASVHCTVVLAHDRPPPVPRRARGPSVRFHEGRIRAAPDQVPRRGHQVAAPLRLAVSARR
jgi:hypothetical protein